MAKASAPQLRCNLPVILGCQEPSHKAGKHCTKQAVSLCQAWGGELGSPWRGQPPGEAAGGKRWWPWLRVSA